MAEVFATASKKGESEVVTPKFINVSWRLLSEKLLGEYVPLTSKNFDNVKKVASEDNWNFLLDFIDSIKSKTTLPDGNMVFEIHLQAFRNNRSDRLTKEHAGSDRQLQDVATGVENSANLLLDCRAASSKVK